MDTMDAIYGRRAVKHFDPEHELSDDEVRTLLEATIQSPTSFNIQHWRFVLDHGPGPAQADPRGRQRSGPDDGCFVARPLPRAT